MDIMIGLDFGSDAVRAIAVDAANGRVLAEREAEYPRWKSGLHCDAGRQIFRQHPADYLDAMTSAVHGVVKVLPEAQRAYVRGIGAGATGSTVCPVDAQGTPLALRPEFADDLGAMFHLWKDHSATEEAKEINAAFANAKHNYLRYQGAYSAEWFWAKILHTVREDPRIRDAAATWVELADWIPNLLAGRHEPAQLYRCACAAGHKALWNTRFGGLPDAACLTSLDPYLAKVAATYPAALGMSTDAVGELTAEWCERFGLPAGVIVSGSSLDAHAGAVGAGIRPRTLVTVIGTSTVDMAVASDAELAGKPTDSACGMAQNSILPGYWGLEAGQAAFGDIFAWFGKLLSWPVEHSDALTGEQKRLVTDNLIGRLQDGIRAGDDSADLVVLDWFNGRRYPNNNDNIRSAAMGLSLGTEAPDLLRAMILGAVMGSRAIFDSFGRAGIAFDRVIAVGGIAQKSPYVMQTMADALNRTVLVSNAQQACALGAAMYAAVATGCHADLATAQQHMNTGFACEYVPGRKRHDALENYYAQYRRLAEMTNEWYA